MSLSSFGKFLTKYADELIGIVGIVRSILPATGMGRDRREGIEQTLERLEQAAANIAKSAPKQSDVVVKKSDLEAAAKSVLGDMVKEEVARQLLAHKTQEGNK